MKLKNRFNRKGCMAAGVIVILAFAVLYLSTTAFPGFGAQGADFLRKIIGDQATSQLEMFVFAIQDSVHQVEYGMGMVRAEAPWQIASPTVQAAPSLTATETPMPTSTPALIPTQATSTLVLTSTLLPPTNTPTPTPWSPPAASASGSLEGEGLWSPYISDASGQTVAYRTFLQPDPKRPYTLVAIVAFDLSRTRLGFVLGIDEPKQKGTPAPKRSGTIPAGDFKPGILIATFSGGFKGEHGNYGAMSNGIVAIPPRNGLATVAMYKNGAIKIGEWGKDLTESDQMVAWRQNCSLIIQNGKINPLVNIDSAEYWGANLNGATVTWRSGIGISPDNNILYFFAGPSMTANILAQTMMSVGVKAGMQLDINNYWVHFIAVRTDGTKLIPDPLFPEDMKFDADRFLKPYTRDFFYVALKSP